MPDQEAIAKRAYELYVERGSAPGYETQDWLQAEAELAAAGEAHDEQRAPGSESDAERPVPAGAARRSGRQRDNQANRRAARP